ncbi:MAG: condensation domain-containing protein [Solirubrobacteraceae bacterium]
MISTDLNVLDQLYLHLDREDEPWSVHLEVAVEGDIDEERLRDAVLSGMRAHPIARARLRRALPTDVHYHWDIAEAVDEASLDVVACEDDIALGAARERLMSHSPSLESAPPFALTLAHHPEGDVVMLNLAHAAGDGMSAVRLMASFLRAYAGEEDPSPEVDPLEVRDIARLVHSRSLKARLARGATLVEQAGRLGESPARIAPQGESDRRGYGFVLLELNREDLETVRSHRRDGATVNDVLLAGLGVAIRRWNDRHGGAVGPLAVMMPVNLRPTEWRNEVVGNFASYVSVRFTPRDLVDLTAAVSAARARTRDIKRHDSAGLVVDLLELPTATLPTAVKRRFQDLITLTGNRLVDSAVLSNLGRLDGVPRLGGSAGEVRRVWFSPPGRMPLGASLGAATYGDELFVCLRYRHALFDTDGAAAFASVLHGVLANP